VDSALVVGAGVAGSACAILPAEAGIAVELVEAERKDAVLRTIMRRGRPAGCAGLLAVLAARALGAEPGSGAVWPAGGEIWWW
jgi:2-polyprenyl-6-methoxyphenol hydroxylase-like FAD-dependent oxidoreductase